MPYFAELAIMPIISKAPRLAEIKAKLVIQFGSDLPDRKKSSLVFIYFFRKYPTAIVIAI
jgi:hypothetical protein